MLSIMFSQKLSSEKPLHLSLCFVIILNSRFPNPTRESKAAFFSQSPDSAKKTGKTAGSLRRPTRILLYRCGSCSTSSPRYAPRIRLQAADGVSVCNIGQPSPAYRALPDCMTSKTGHTREAAVYFLYIL